ncbi:G protein-coupled glucose receptor regulating Gpa2-domain-containing protein [Poronia punctata]|nr:G protein-coupled glucose receptor regulating Gpa2-domain-containing protein [Poronia punctata]
MAPLQDPIQSLLAAAEATSFTSSAHDAFIMKRSSPEVFDFRDSQMLAVMCVSLSFAAVSVIAALFAFYWFIRMRRGFRQDMIMLLIQSDMAKALWLIISPLFYFFNKKQTFGSDYVFCQVSGFFLTATIEASDLAVLLIAIHTALFIVKRQHPGAPVGLQPYRRAAYCIWAILPLIMASLVPLTGGNYVDNGPHCYLPTHPGWYRSGLSWLPRYAIFGFILVTYTWLYLYVYFRFRKFGETQRTATTTTSDTSSRRSRRSGRMSRILNRSVPPTPPIATHGLLDSAPGISSRYGASKYRRHSGTSTVSTWGLAEPDRTPFAAERAVRKSSISWNLVDYSRDGSISPRAATPAPDAAPLSPATQYFTSARDSTDDIAAPATVTAPEPVYHRPTIHNSVAGESNTSRLGSLREVRYGRWRRRPNSQETSLGSRRNSLSVPLGARQQGTTATQGPDDTSGRDEVDSSHSSLRLATEVSGEVMQRSRERMQRQMRLLFVYPAIYVLTWVAPFIQHVYGYDAVYPGSDQVQNATSFYNLHTSYDIVNDAHRAATLPPERASESLALRLVSMASLCIGAAVDCGFFTAWEKPWKHLRSGFWEGLAVRLRLHRICGLARDDMNYPGRDRDEQIAEERVARRRREREIETDLRGRSQMGSINFGPQSMGGLSRASDRSRREWWDVLDDDEEYENYEYDDDNGDEDDDYDDDPHR